LDINEFGRGEGQDGRGLRLARTRDMMGHLWDCPGQGKGLDRYEVDRKGPVCDCPGQGTGSDRDKAWQQIKRSTRLIVHCTLLFA
jgi:hypothetical protein